MHIYLTLFVDGDSVTPTVAVENTRAAFMRGEAAPASADNLATVRLGTEITNRVLDFAEGIKR
jgi:hypothetical protein